LRSADRRGSGGKSITLLRSTASTLRSSPIAALRSSNSTLSDRTLRSKSSLLVAQLRDQTGEDLLLPLAFGGHRRGDGGSDPSVPINRRRGRGDHALELPLPGGAALEVETDFLLVELAATIALDYDSPDTGLPPMAVPSGPAANAFIPVIEL
jgi:hypothetical protein